MIDIKQTFLELTKRTHPHGTEAGIIKLLPNNLQKDSFGNLYIQIGESSTMFTSHIDTADRESKEVIHVIEDNIIKTDGNSILGADDRAGVAIMLYMIEEKVPGLYYFFLGEEVGCLGSRDLAKRLKEDNIFNYITKVVSFDRYGLTSVITFQTSGRCCSDDFANALAKELNDKSIEVVQTEKEKFSYKIDEGGIYTDSAQFISIFPECTNISVGYYSQHTTTERQDIDHLEKLAKTCCLVDWESLPIKRDPSKTEYRTYRYNGYGYHNDYYDGWYEDYGYEYRHRNIPKEEKKFFLDEEFKGIYSSSVTVEKGTNKVKSVDFSKERLDYEKTLIEELFLHLDVLYKEVLWSGEKAIISYDEDNIYKELDREELSEFLPELDFWKYEVERQNHSDIFDNPSFLYV